MFVFLPFWRDDALRFPILTGGIIALTVVVFLLTWPAELKRASVVDSDRLDQAVQSLMRLAVESKPSLSSEQQAFVQKYIDTQEKIPISDAAAFFAELEKSRPFDNRVDYEWDTRYPLFNSLHQSFLKNPTATSPFRQYGFYPGRSLLGLITHQFLHAGILHLAFNMLFLWVFGLVLEEEIGVHLIWVYIGGGISAALAQSAWSLPAHQVMVGASGAVSSLMGFSFFLTPNAKIKCFWLSMLMIMPRYGVFNAPLWFFCPLWVMEQIGMAILMKDSALSNVGYAAHIGGFVFGCLGGLVFNKSR
jgi:membrane associated rhomboid family serine protease